MNNAEFLTFSVLDDLAFANQSNDLDIRNSDYTFTASELGPVIEFLHLSRCKVFPLPEEVPCVDLDDFEALYKNLRIKSKTQWISPGKRFGFFRTSKVFPEDDTPWIQFSLAAQKAAVSVGFPKQLAAQLVGALGEMQSNIYEHSQNSLSGIVAFNARPDIFEFAVTDLGIGVLESLRSGEEFNNLSDAGEALELTLKEGVSRHGAGSNRGFGFRPLFQGLANLNGFLRFRSENQALTLNGQNPGNIPAQIAEKPYVKGFLASVSCSNN